MSWLNPTTLYLLALAAVPVVLHFLMRERVQKVVFSATRFLRKQHREALSRRRRLEWLLTALRIACVVVLVLAFARPFFTSAAGERAAPGTRPETVILLDASRSMTFGSRFDDARAAAEKIIKAAGDDAAIQFVTFADAANIAIKAAADPQEALDALRRAKPSSAATDILAAVDRVFAALASHANGGEVHLISDLQASGIARGRDVHPMPRGFSFHVHAIGQEKGTDDGIAVEGADPFAEVMPEEGNLVISARVLNRGKAREVEAQLVVEGKPVASRRMLLPQYGEKVISLTGTVRETGEHAGQVVIKGAPVLLKGDDQFHFVARVVSKVRVAVVNGSPSPVPAEDAAFYLVEALNAGEASPFQAEAYPALPPLQGADVVVLASVASLPAADAQRLADFVEGGGGLLISLGPGIRPDLFNASVGRFAPAHLRTWKDTPAGSFLVTADAKHPLVLKVVADGKGDLSVPRFDGSFELKDTQGAQVLLRFDDNRPALLERHEGKGAVMLFAGGLDRRSTNFPLRAIFVPFVRESIGVLSARRDRSAALALGDSLSLAPSDELAPPEGPPLRGAGTEATLCTLAQPGIYRLRSKERTELYAINVAPGESDLTPAGAADVEKMFAAAKESEIRKTATGYERVLAPEDRAKAERRWNIGWWALFATMGLVASELWLAQVVSRQ